MENAATYGGGILISATELYLFDGSIQNNTAQVFGGGLALSYGDGGTAYLKGGVISNNISPLGADIYNNGDGQIIDQR